jgi:hypothetical protein
MSWTAADALIATRSCELRRRDCCSLRCRLRRRHVTRMINSNRFAVSASWMVPASHRTKCRPKP